MAHIPLVSLAQCCCNRPLRCSSVIQYRLEEVQRLYYLCPSSLVPHHDNPKGSFQIRRWCAREQCHGFPRKAQVLLHSQKPLRRDRWFTAILSPQIAHADLLSLSVAQVLHFLPPLVSVSPIDTFVPVAMMPGPTIVSLLGGSDGGVTRQLVTISTAFRQQLAPADLPRPRSGADCGTRRGYGWCAKLGGIARGPFMVHRKVTLWTPSSMI